MSINALAAEYPGNDAWSKFAHAVGAADDLIPSVVDAIMGKRGTGWLATPIAALDGKTPHEVLASDRGIETIRSLVMRLP
jgi:uncharacterized protein (DUF2384 family)